MNRLRRKSQVLTTQCVRQGCFSRHYDESLILICPLIFHELFNSIRTGPYPGPVMICMNGLLFIVHFIREHRLTGICTIDDMIPLYRPLFIMPFFPISIFISQIENITSFVIAITGFVISPALPMNSESGLARYDDLTVMISNALHIPSMQYAQHGIFSQSLQDLPPAEASRQEPSSWHSHSAVPYHSQGVF